MSKVETGSCDGSFEWLFIVLGTVFAIVDGIVGDLPRYINFAVFGFILTLWVWASFYILLNIFNKKKLKAFFNYRVETEFVGINILYPPMWTFYILAGVCIVFWLLSFDFMGLIK